MEGTRIGVVVDAVLGGLRASAGGARCSPAPMRGVAAQYVTGILSRPGPIIVVPAVAKLLSTAERGALGGPLVEASHE